jgi:uncharacterized membrane protein
MALTARAPGFRHLRLRDKPAVRRRAGLNWREPGAGFKVRGTGPSSFELAGSGCQSLDTECDLMADRTFTLSLAAVLAGAVSLATLAGGPAMAQTQEKCFGISKAHENDCANKAGTHSCAGLSEDNYSGGDWKLVATGTCLEMGGQLEPFEGFGQPPQEG